MNEQQDAEARTGPASSSAGQTANAQYAEVATEEPKTEEQPAQHPAENTVEDEPTQEVKTEEPKAEAQTDADDVQSRTSRDSYTDLPASSPVSTGQCRRCCCRTITRQESERK